MFAYSLDAPYAAMGTHLGGLQKGNYHPKTAAKTFSQKHSTEKEAIDLAIKLKTLLEAAGIDIDVTQVPQEAHCIDPQAQYHQYQLTEVFPYLVRVNQQGGYSEETARGIAVLAQEPYPLVLARLQDLFPSSFNETFVGLYLWQYVVLMIHYLWAFM